MDSDYLVKLFIDHLKELETSRLQGQLIPEHSQRLTEIVPAFNPLGQEIEASADNFFKSFFLTVAQVPYILNADQILDSFEKSLAIFAEFKSELEVPIPDSDNEIYSFIEEYKLTLENRLEAINSEQDFFHKYKDECVENTLTIIRVNARAQLLLRIQNELRPLIGMNDLLNYQIMQVIDLNRMILEELKQRAEDYDIDRVYVASEEGVSKAMTEDFMAQIQEDKEQLNHIKECSTYNDDDQEFILDIGAELAMNLLYKIAWDDRYQLELYGNN